MINTIDYKHFLFFFINMFGCICTIKKCSMFQINVCTFCMLIVEKLLKIIRSQEPAFKHWILCIHQETSIRCHETCDCNYWWIKTAKFIFFQIGNLGSLKYKKLYSRQIKQDRFKDNLNIHKKNNNNLSALIICSRKIQIRKLFTCQNIKIKLVRAAPKTCLIYFYFCAPNFCNYINRWF